jgi:hypothetical protein
MGLNRIDFPTQQGTDYSGFSNIFSNVLQGYKNAREPKKIRQQEQYQDFINKIYGEKARVAPEVENANLYGLNLGNQQTAQNIQQSAEQHPLNLQQLVLQNMLSKQSHGFNEQRNPQIIDEGELNNYDKRMRNLFLKDEKDLTIQEHMERIAYNKQLREQQKELHPGALTQQQRQNNALEQEYNHRALSDPLSREGQYQTNRWNEEQTNHMLRQWPLQEQGQQLANKTAMENLKHLIQTNPEIVKQLLLQNQGLEETNRFNKETNPSVTKQQNTAAKQAEENLRFSKEENPEKIKGAKLENKTKEQALKSAKKNDPLKEQATRLANAWQKEENRQQKERFPIDLAAKEAQTLKAVRDSERLRLPTESKLQKLMRERDDAVLQKGKDSAEVKTFDDAINKESKGKDAQKTAAIRTMETKATISNEIRKVALARYNIPDEYLGWGGSNRADNDVDEYNNPRTSPKRKAILEDRLTRFAVAKILVPEIAAHQVQSQRQNQGKYSQEEQQKALQQGWPWFTSAIIAKLPQSIQAKVAGAHGDALEVLNKAGEEAHSKLDASGAFIPLAKSKEVQQKAEDTVMKDLKGKEFTMEDVEKTARESGLSIDKVIEIVSRK